MLQKIRFACTMWTCAVWIWILRANEFPCYVHTHTRAYVVVVVVVFVFASRLGAMRPVSEDLRIESGDAGACEFARTIVMSPERFTICHTGDSATLCAGVCVCVYV